jgi:hypothetical protein
MHMDECVFFLGELFFTGGHRNLRLPQDLENLGNLPDEIIQTNFEFEFFSLKTNIFHTRSKLHCLHALAVGA